MSQHSISMKLLSTAGLVGLLAAVPGARTGSAQGMNDMVRTLNNVLNPGDAQRLEDQARRNGRLQEERYWRDYRAGLDSPDGNRRDYGRSGDRPDYRERGDYRNRRDEGFQGDSGPRRDYRGDPRDYRYDQR
jgi:hypothetical protein